MSSSSDGSELCKETTWSSSDSPSDDEFFIPTHVYEEESDASPAAVTKEGTKHHNQLARFIAMLRPKMLNLMNEFADAEMFLIDGDSLFVELLLDTNLDWCYGGQFLHLIYLCERYLHLFVRKGGVFQLVFFQDFQDLWKCEPSLYLARQALKLHLCEHIDNKVLCEFNNPWDPKFAQYVDTFCPSFMLLSDGDINERLSSRPFSIPKYVSDVFLCELDQCLKLGLNCAFTAGVEFGTSTLDGYHVECSGRFQTIKLAKHDIMDKVRSDNRKPQIVLGQNVEDVISQLISEKSVSLAEECKDDGSQGIDCRLFLHLAAASIYLKSISDDQPCKASHQDIVRLVLLHGVLLTQLPLKYRALSLGAGNCDEIKEPVVQQNLLRCFANIQFVISEFLESLLESPKASSLDWSKVDICDIWDGRLLFVLLSLLLIAKRNGVDISLSSCSRQKFVSLVNDVSSLSGEEIKPFPILSCLGGNLQSELENMLNVTQSQARNPNNLSISSKSRTHVMEHLASPELEREGLIKIDCPLLSKYAGEIVDTPSVKKLDLDDPTVAALVMSGNDFDETYHWHSGKPLSDAYDRTKQNTNEGKSKKAVMRNQGKFATYMRRYGESLEGEISSKPIVVEHHGKHRKKDKSKTSKKSQRIIEENIKRKEEETAIKEKELWAKEKKVLQHLIEQQQYGDALGKIVTLLDKVSVKEITIAVLMMKVMVHWKKWKLVCEDKVSQELKVNISDAETCFLTTRDIIENHGESLQKKEKATLGEYLVGLGFGDIAVKISLVKELDASGDGSSLNMSSARFQLQCIGHQLKRETRTDPDPRVDRFIPETWQRELLDAVDNKQSALIVAPTSSGKTFASYYCMERVLKEDNEGVVVYVSPTKALVNQVAATCHARYHKVMPAGKSVCGVFTRDYRSNALNSQILVTVPQCLEILLLSPHRQDWAAKIKYVVFDEVHCLGSEIGAEFWEHLLLLVRCPFLALSATIRNPHDLHKWLQCAEDDKRKRDEKNNTVRPNSPKSYEVALVTYHERYSDLEKFNYVAPAGIKKGGPQINSPELKHTHPCAMLTVRQLTQSSTFPAHVTLSPRETLALYDAMIKAWPEKDSMQLLSPENYFKDKSFISKPDARLYEAALKEEFMTWLNNRRRVEIVIASLGGKTTAESSQKTGRDDEYVIRWFYPLLQKLHDDNKLPAIFFSYNRKLCERLTSLTVRYLCKKEKRLQLDLGRNAQLKSYKKQGHQIAKRDKRIRDNCQDEDEGKMRKAKSSGHQSFHNKSKQVPGEASCFLFDNAPEKSCSFARKGVLDEEEGRIIVQPLQRFQSGENLSTFMEGLRRGVSYHHSGMSAKQRGIVEMLFRKKFLRVIFATGTLALGIHMPCKTVIFAGDSVFLNTLQYHQISGRAGRRGFDLLGNVIFLGIPQSKIQRLMTNNLPRLIGNFPLNTTLVLRLLLMVNKVDDRETAMTQALTLLQNPLICMDQPELDLQLKHHFLFSVELLVRQGLVDQKGVPQGLAGLVTHLHYHEPSNLVLVAFLQAGIFHNFCKRGRSSAKRFGGKFSKDFLMSLLIVLSHLFARQRLHNYILCRERSTSKLVLDELPPKFKEALAKHNNRVHEVFDLYLRTVATHVFDAKGEDITLPLSNAKLISSVDYSSAAPDPTECGPTVEERLQALSLPYKACSAFAALSGNTDNCLYSSEELISNIRCQVYTDIKVVPILKDDLTLNAYVVDFFNHGNVKALVSENGIMHGDVFNLLKDFLLVIKSIHVSLSELGPEDGDDVVIAAFGQLAEEFSSVFRKAFNILDFAY